MQNSHDPKPIGAIQAIAHADTGERAAAQVLATLKDLTPEQLAELHARPRPDSLRLLRKARRADSARRWHAACPPLLRHSDWTHPTMQANAAQIAQVRAWTPRGDGRGLLLTGPTGLGKSRAFWSLLRRLMAHEARDVEVWHAAAFFRSLQEQINYGRDESARWLARRAEKAVLAIDDFGQQAVLTARSDWAEAAFFDLIDRRLGHRRPTILTTNLNARQIATGHELRGDPLLRRLLDACEVVRFQVPQAVAA